MLNKIITKSLYSLYDLYYGRKISKHYEEIKAQNSINRTFDTEKLRKYLNRWNLGNDIKNLPLMAKKDVRSYTSQLNPKDISSFVYTGGSSGDPLKVPYSKERELVRTASITFYNEIGGYSVGDRFLLIRAKQKSRFSQFLRNEILFVPHDLSMKNIKELTIRIIEKKVRVLIGYPSVIYQIAVVLDSEKKLKKNKSVASIITVSEPIDDIKREFIKKVFNCRLIDRYSNEENGVIAQQFKYGGEYIVDRYNIYTEILVPDTYQPANEGEVGKVVVTDVSNDLIPMVRYDTGDYAMVSSYKNDQLYSLKKIVGRSSEEIFTADGRPISPLSLGPCIHQPFSKAGLICQFQFAQVGKQEYQLRVQGLQPGDYERAVNEVITELKNVLGKNAKIEPVFVEEIQPLPSGKRPLYRNEINE